MQRQRSLVPTALKRVPAMLAAVLIAASVVAQPPPGGTLPQPRITLAAPNGAKVGTTVIVSVTGTDTEDPEALLFSNPGIKAKLIEEPVDPKVDPKKKPKGGPVLTHRFEVTVPADAPLGHHDLRVVNKFGASNPRAFIVGDLNEVAEKEGNNDVEQAQKVELNSTINGVINAPTDVDYYSFKGQKGQRVVVSCLASSIESKAHPLIEMYDPAGKKLAGNRNYDHHDALLDATLATDGDYLVRVAQFTHTAGGPEYTYRLSISTAPWIDGVFPPMVEVGKPAQVTVYGRNLPGGQPDPTMVLDGSILEKATVTITAPNDPLAAQRLAHSDHIAPPSSNLDGFDYRLKNAAGSSNAYLVQIARAPVVLETGKNTTRDTAQALTLPCEVAGRLERARTQGWYAFNARKDETVGIELLGDRIGSALDLSFTVYNGATKAVIVEQDDDPETLSTAQFFTRSTDPARYLFKAPADGTYQVQVKSNENPNRASVKQMYRLRLSPEQPDFRLVAMAPSTIFPEATLLRPGAHQDVTVFVWRRDGFNGEIALSMEGLPPGVLCKPQLVGPGAKQASLIVTTGAEAAPWTGDVKIKGTAKINGQPVVREARPATITWAGNPQQQNVPLFSRLDHALVMAIREKAPYTITLATDTAQAVQGDKVTLPVKIDRHWPDFKTPVSVQALNLPTGVTFNNNNAPMAVANDNGSLVLTVGAQVIPGTYTLAFRGNAQVPYSKDPMAKTKPNVNLTSASNPVTVTILPKQVANLTATPPNPTVKAGESVEVVVKAARLNSYQGDLKVELVQPPNAKGLTAAEAVIPAGKDEVKITITVAADAPAGPRNDLILKATAMYGATPVSNDSKFTLVIAKK